MMTDREIAMRCMEAAADSQHVMISPDDIVKRAEMFFAWVVKHEDKAPAPSRGRPPKTGDKAESPS